MSEWSHNDGADYIFGTPLGAIDPTFIAQKAQMPKISFTTSAVKTALDATGLGSIPIAAGNPAYFRLQKMEQGGAYETGSVHKRITVNRGIGIPRSLSAGHDKQAEISYEVTCLYDGTNAPMIITSGQTLGGVATFEEYFLAGPASVNGINLSGVQSIKVDYNLKDVHLGGDGELWPSFSAYIGRSMSITIRAIDVDSMATLGFSPITQTTPSVMYLRKVQNGGARVPDSTEEHIRLSVNQAQIVVTKLDAKPAQPAEIEIKITPTYDGTNAVVVVNTESEIN